MRPAVEARSGIERLRDVVNQRIACCRRVRERIFGLIEREHRLADEMVLTIVERGALLAHHPVLAESIQLRNRYVDPLSFLQIEFLRQWRDEASQTDSDETLERLLALTANGIAFGMKSTGSPGI